MLAKAGFYYTGFGDNVNIYLFYMKIILKNLIYLKVKCFHCGGGLNKWKPNDSPIDEHRKWFDSCEFIR